MSEHDSRDGKGVQAYRWLVSVGIAAITTLCTIVLLTVQRTADDVSNLRSGFATLTTTQTHQSARMDSIDKRNDEQDKKIENLKDRIYQIGLSIFPRSAPSTSEDRQRQQWQQDR